jgi:hypothetical protein
MDASFPELAVDLLEEKHQFRNESEVHKESKGNYVKADVRLPHGAARREFTLDLGLAPAEEDSGLASDVAQVHPNLLYLKGNNNNVADLGLDLICHVASPQAGPSAPSATKTGCSDCATSAWPRARPPSWSPSAAGRRPSPPPPARPSSARTCLPP